MVNTYDYHTLKIDIHSANLEWLACLAFTLSVSFEIFDFIIFHIRCCLYIPLNYPHIYLIM